VTIADDSSSLPSPPNGYPNKMSEEQEKLAFSKFQNFMQTHGKKYQNSDELASKFQVFKDNYVKLQDIISKKESAHESGITQFFDLTPEEFSKIYATLQVEDLEQISTQATTPKDGVKRKLTTLPTNFDWRNYGAVGVVKNQGQCGGCWAFATVANAEGQYQIKYGKLYNLSEQQLIDCNYTNSACNGGSISAAMSYVNSYRGIMYTSYYPFLGYQSTCKWNSSKALPLASTWISAGSSNEETIRAFLYNTGPVAIAMNAAVLQYYNGGIITSCYSNVVDHGVTLVGYGTSTSGYNYWIIKNSWGAYWGESGYFRIERNYGLCGINTYALSLSLY